MEFVTQCGAALTQPKKPARGLQQDASPPVAKRHGPNWLKGFLPPAPDKFFGETPNTDGQAEVSAAFAKKVGMTSAARQRKTRGWVSSKPLDIVAVAEC